jgi:hypothetical protein
MSARRDYGTKLRTTGKLSAAYSFRKAKSVTDVTLACGYRRNPLLSNRENATSIRYNFSIRKSLHEFQAGKDSNELVQLRGYT